MRGNRSLKRWLAQIWLLTVTLGAVLIMSCADDDSSSMDTTSPTTTEATATQTEWNEQDLENDEFEDEANWRMSITAVAPDMIRAGSGRCLDNMYGYTTNGNKIQEWDCLANTNQTWYLKNGFIVSDVGGKCLDDAYGYTTNGNKIQIWDCTTGNQAQIFNYTGGQIVLSKSTNKCLDVTGGSTTNGTKIQLYDCNGSAAQQWTFANGEYHSGLNTDKCLDVSGAANANGTQVQLYTCNSSTAQKWSPTNMTVQNSNGKCLDVAGGSSADGTKAQLYDCNGSSAQQWTWWRNDLKAMNKCLDISNSGTANGTQVQIWGCDGNTRAQDWYATEGPAPASPLATKPTGVNGNCRVGGSCVRDNSYKAHSGTDFATSANNTAYAICNGTVKYINNGSSVSEKVVIVEHRACGGYPTLYAYYGHVASSVSTGATITRGQKIGVVGDWGSNTHMHFGLATRYVTSYWGYPITNVSTANSCSNDNTRRDQLLNVVNSTSSGGWIDSYSFARSYNWWGSAVTVGSCS
ncbi:MAG: ricin-type beta-trefoil lectin domain protein [Patescibacteria group bacterium]